MNNSTLIALIGLGSAIATGIGIKVTELWIAKQKVRGDLQLREFDDGVLRRQELIKEVERLNIIIGQKDDYISKLNVIIEKWTKDFYDMTVKYTRLEVINHEALDELERFKTKVIDKVDEVKKDISNITQ